MKIHLYNNEQGFSLIEVIIAVSVLAIGILAATVLQTSSVRLNSNARSITEASTFATDEMEYRMTLNFQDAYLQNGSYAIDKDCCPNHPAVLSGYRINTNIMDTAYLEKEVTVNVSWSNFGSLGRDRTVSFQSIKPRLREK